MTTRTREPLIFERSVAGKVGMDLPRLDVPAARDTRPAHLKRTGFDALPSVTEVDVIRHFTRLSKWNYGVDDGFYPLGSCTMKHNPRINEKVAGLAGFADSHPLAPAEHVQGNLAVLYTLQEWLKEITGLPAVTLQPCAGAHGELTGVMLIRCYHVSRGARRRVILLPDSAHGTNPATAAMAGYDVVVVASQADGTVSFEDVTGADGKVQKGLTTLLAELKEDVAGLMVTNPNTLGLFEEEIVEIAVAVHEVGGLLYYDGANLNAILGVVRPGDMGFDIVHMNLHKTFATPHGGGGPGAGPVAVSSRLVDFLPGPKAIRLDDGTYQWVKPPRSIGRVHGWHGNAMVLARALAYINVHGGDGLTRVAQHAVLNANWLRQRLSATLPAAYDRVCMHECVLSATALKANFGVRGLDVAKALLEEGFHSPTVYFPLIVDEALMFEPTETESLQTLEALAEAVERIAQRAVDDPESLHRAPQTTPVSRVDEARAARHLIPTEDAAER